MPRAAFKTATASIRPAESFRRSRRDRALEIVQDYVEAIAELAVECGEVRVVDLARRMGVTHVTVNHTINRLQAAGYVSMEPYQAIYLTGPGQKLARECKQRHKTVVAFLRSIGVPEKLPNWMPKASSITSVPELSLLSGPPCGINHRLRSGPERFKLNCSQLFGKDLPTLSSP